MNAAVDSLLQADQSLFLRLNGYHDPFWDNLMVAFTYKFTWIPLYLVLVYSLISRFKAQAVGYLLCMIAVVALSDQIASGIFKPYFMRLRPCHDPFIGSLVHVLGGCGGQYGFVSSHAATGFGIATSFNLLLQYKSKSALWLFCWALVYSYSRVYVGVHYPLDILVGALVGVFVAIFVTGIYRFSTRSTQSRYF